MFWTDTYCQHTQPEQRSKDQSKKTKTTMRRNTSMAYKEIGRKLESTWLYIECPNALFTCWVTVKLGGHVAVIGNIRNDDTKILNRREPFANLDLNIKFNLGKIRCDYAAWIICLNLDSSVNLHSPLSEKVIWSTRQKSMFVPRSEHNETLRKQGISWPPE